MPRNAFKDTDFANISAGKVIVVETQVQVPVVVTYGGMYNLATTEAILTNNAETSVQVAGIVDVSFDTAPAVDSIPTMTGPTSPSGFAFADASHATTPDPWKGMDDNDATAWGGNHNCSPSTPGVLGYIFASPKVITRFSMKAREIQDWANQVPKNFTFEGSNIVTSANAATNDVDWTVIATYTNEPTYSPNQKREYLVNNSTAYTAYRIRATSTVHGYFALKELELKESPPPTWVRADEVDQFTLAFTPGSLDRTHTVKNVSGATQKVQITHIVEA